MVERGINMPNLSIEGKTRIDILQAALNAGKTGAHIAPSLSLVEIALAILKHYDMSKDTFVLSKGHGALGYYAAMHQMKVITDEQFASFENNGGEFPGQPSRTNNNHIDYSGGSLGMGLCYGVGTAIACPDANTFVVMGDGEVNEGSVWEAAMMASKRKLSNLIAVVDQNGLQSDGKCEEILGMDLERIWKAYGWNTVVCEGHSIDAIESAINNRPNNIPTVILAQTVKGKGISFMENDNAWHHHELKQDEYALAVEEIGVKYGIK